MLPRFGFDYRVTDDVLAYVIYNKGFKSGGFDMRGNATANPATREGYDSEVADNYEIGMKSTWLDDTLQLNLTAFYTPYKDVQITTQQFQIVGGNPTNVTAVLNAGKQLNKGVELESIWRPIAPLTLVLNVGWLDAEFEEFLIGCTPPSAGCTTDVSALNEPINSPDWTTFLGATYRWELGVGDLAAHAGYQYRAKTKVANTVRSITDQDAYDVLDLGVSYTTVEPGVALRTGRQEHSRRGVSRRRLRLRQCDDAAHQSDRLLRPATHRLAQRDLSLLIPLCPPPPRAGEGAF